MTDMFASNNDDPGPFGAPGRPANGSDFEFDMDVSSLELPADGTYMIRVVDIKREMAQSGFPMIVWDFIIMSNKFAFRAWTSLQDNAMWKVLEYTSALGIPPAEGRLKFNRADIIGKRCIADLAKRVNPNNNRENLNIEKIYPAKPDDTPEMFAGPKVQQSDVPF